jgi:hypothetical protein
MALVHDGRVLVSARKKAEAFVKEYERVSRVRVPREFRMKKMLNGCLRMEGPEREDSSPVTFEEVETTLAEMDGGRSAGPDGIHPRLLRNLPKEALEVVRSLFDRSLHENWRPGFLKICVWEK